MLSKDSFNCGIDSLLCSKYLVMAWKDFESFSKNVYTNDFDFIFGGFDFVFGIRNQELGIILDGHILSARNVE
ncbi:MAG: hypothetical protein IPG09_14290 [Ignavibacteria bacterium]|nr:hypothetical protein [Ignavibacteria bacterium]